METEICTLIYIGIIIVISYLLVCIWLTNGIIKYKVQTTKLYNFLKKNKIKLIDILKVDVDGSEYKFLQGAKNTLKNNKVKTILIEISDKKDLYRKKEKKILNFLQKRNFALVEKSNIFTVSIFSNIKSGDYLFVNNKKLMFIPK